MLRQQRLLGYVSVGLTVGLVLLLSHLFFSLTLQAGSLAAPSQQSGFNCTKVTTIAQSECAALVDIYNITNGSSWLTKTNWLFTPDPCTWYGVTCLNSHVDRLGLINNNLTGQLPNTIDGLTHITTLNLFDNRLTGTIPVSVLSLTTLIQLRLDNNLLGGSLPSELGNLQNLEVLNLRLNNFTGAIPPQLTALTKLRSLVLNDNLLSGPIPANLTDLPNLYRLYLQRNSLSGPLPTDIGNLSSLTELLLGSNQLSGELPRSLISLQAQLNPNIVGFNNNRFTSNDADVRAAMQVIDPDWEATQTVPPTQLQGGSASATTIQLTWQKIQFEAGGGYYQISYLPTGSSANEVLINTGSKSVTSYQLTGLLPNTTYQIRMRTFTPAYDTQKNDLLSDFGPTIAVTTGAVTPTATPTVTPTLTPTNTPTPTPTLTPIPPTSTPTTRVDGQSSPTPTSTPTFTPTPTFTVTPTFTATNTPRACSIASANSAVCRSYLPLVSWPHTPTFTPTATPTTPSPANWLPVTARSQTVASLAIHEGTFFFGTIGSRGSTRGLYRGSLATCRNGVVAPQVSDVNQPGGERVYDIVFAESSGVIASYEGGIYYSNNDGNQWQRSTTVLPQPRTVAKVGSTFFAGTEVNGVYRSSDNGNTWSLLSEEPQAINVVRLDGAFPDILWIGTAGEGVYALEGTLRQNQNGLSGAALQVWDFAFDADRVYLATEGGVFVGDGTTAWTSYGAPAGVKFRSLELVNGVLYAGAEGNGLWRRLNNDTWERVTSAGWNETYTLRDLLYDPTHCDGLLAATNDGVWLYPVAGGQ